MLKAALLACFLFIGVNFAQAETQACKQCMSKCPHQTRDIKACDRGCPEECDQDSLATLLRQAKQELANCNARKPSSSKKK